MLTQWIQRLHNIYWCKQQLLMFTQRLPIFNVSLWHECWFWCECDNFPLIYPRSSILNKDLLLHLNPYKTIKNVHTKLAHSHLLQFIYSLFVSISKSSSTLLRFHFSIKKRWLLDRFYLIRLNESDTVFFLNSISWNCNFIFIAVSNP